MNGTDSSKVTAEWVLKQQATAIMIIFLVWASGNLYFNGARAWEKEINAVTDAEHTVDISVEKKEDGWYLKTNLYDIIKEENDGIISTETLGMAFEPGAEIRKS